MDAADAGGNRRVKYTYDFKGQLTEEWDSIPGQAPIVRSYTYDAAGNRTGGGYRYDSANRLLATPTDTFTYDAVGNLTWWKNKSSGRYKDLQWDAEGQLLSVRAYAAGAQYADTIVSFIYDGTGRRILKSVSILWAYYPWGPQYSDYATRYIWDGSELIGTIEISGIVVHNPGRRYTPHPTKVDRVLSVATYWGDTAYFHTDAGGSVTRITDRSGSTVSRYRYDAFGNRTVVGSEGYTGRIMWQGRESDRETGLYYFRARYYLPQLGRFISEDPVGVTHAQNLYLFGFNDAVNLKDPHGSNACDAIEDEKEREKCYTTFFQLVQAGTHTLNEINEFLADLVEPILKEGRVTFGAARFFGYSVSIQWSEDTGINVEIMVGFGFGAGVAATAGRSVGSTYEGWGTGFTVFAGLGSATGEVSCSGDTGGGGCYGGVGVPWDLITFGGGGAALGGATYITNIVPPRR